MRPEHEFEKLILNNNAIDAMSKLFYASYFFDLPNNTFAELHSDVLKVHSTIGKNGNLRETMRLMSEQLVRPEYKEMIAEFTDIDTLDERMKDREFITCDYEGAISGWSEAIFLVVDRLDNGCIYHVLFLIRTISEKKRKEYEEIKQLKDDLEFERLSVMSLQQVLGSAMWNFYYDENNNIITEPSDSAFMSMLGYNEDFDPEIDVMERIHPDDRERVSEAMRTVLSDSTRTRMFDEEYRIMVANGQYKWFRGAGKLNLREGVPGATFFGVLVDMNDKVLAQQAYTKEREKTEEQLMILSSIADGYLTMHLLDFVEDTAEEITSMDKRTEMLEVFPNAEKLMSNIISCAVVEKDKTRALEFMKFDTVKKVLKEKKLIAEELLCYNFGWIRATFFVVDREEDGTPRRVLFTTMVIEEEKRREEELLLKSNTDKLTRFLNRTAYEEDMSAFAFDEDADDFVFISLDLNGLKNVNDTYGHAAGDELIVGAATCMQETIGNYGKLYRIGGDEFVAMIQASEETLSSITDNFERAYRTWCGNYVDSMSISYGYATKKEFSDSSIEELARMADERMYEDKANYYRTKGVDRRGQVDAFNAICDSYTRISKIDLTNDRYQDVRSLDDLSALSSLFSVSMKELVRERLIAEDDIEYFEKYTDIDALRSYFKRGNKSFCIRYRRRIDDDYRLVMMELIRTPEYTDENQVVFMYVKDIDFM